jgi:hypothetical protein
MDMSVIHKLTNKGIKKQTKKQKQTYWQSTHERSPSTSVKNVHTSLAPRGFGAAFWGLL